MNRRDFKKLVFWGSLAAGSQKLSISEEMIKPNPLMPGDRIGLIAPGSAIPEAKIAKSIATLKTLGLRYKLGTYARSKNGFLAGTDNERLSDLHEMFSDTGIKGIWCLRGGYGCTRLLPSIDYELVRNNPKIFIGYSDVTALHLAFYRKSNLVTYHGPVASSEPTPYTMKSLREITFGHKTTIMESGRKEDNLETPYVISAGQAEGILVGGNLSLLAAMTGTEWLPDFQGKIVFIEDIGEKPYRIDRMLVQLFQATDLSLAAGIVFGQFNDCEGDEGENSLTLRQTLEGQCKHLNIPTYYGFSFGHVDNNCTIPIGIRARFDTSSAQLELLEGPTNN